MSIVCVRDGQREVCVKEGGRDNPRIPEQLLNTRCRAVLFASRPPLRNGTSSISQTWLCPFQAGASPHSPCLSVQGVYGKHRGLFGECKKKTRALRACGLETHTVIATQGQQMQDIKMTCVRHSLGNMNVTGQWIGECKNDMHAPWALEHEQHIDGGIIIKKPRKLEFLKK